MKHFSNRGYFFFLSIVMLLLGACSGGVDVGSNEDTASPVVSLTCLNTNEEVVGSYSITWDNNEPHPSTVTIELSTDSGETFPHVIAQRAPDTGSYTWDSNISPDGRQCRIRITAVDVVGNVSEPVVSAADFIINNVPQVLGSALYYDTGNDGLGDGDKIVIPFDKDIELLASMVSNVFTAPVLGDEIGPLSTMELGSADNELIITINDLAGPDFHLHVGGTYSSERTYRTAPSGLDILENLPGKVIFSPETDRTAAPAGDGIDIGPTFGEGAASGITAVATIDVALGDLNNDGALDAVVINQTTSNSVFTGNYDGTFTNFGSQALGNIDNTSVAIGYLDADNDLDIVVGVGNSGANLVYTNNGSATFGLAQSLGSSTTNGVALGDIDNNNTLDLVTGNNGANRVWRNDGTANFSEDGTPQVLGSDDTRAIALGDVDGDGDLDMVAGNFGSANRVYLNNGSGVFTDSGQTLGGSDTLSIALGDVDGDGDLDLISGNDNTQTNRLFLNDGAGMFTDSQQTLGTNKAWCLKLADIDDDNDLDLLVGNDNDDDKINRVWFNNGSGIFSDSGQSLGTSATRSFAVGDIDDDGDLDILEGITGTASDVVWLNSQRTASQAVFINSEQSLGAGDTRAVASGDIDGDGDLDMVAGNVGGANRVYINNGSGMFTDSGQALGNNDTLSTALGDVDGDGDLDMVTGNGSGQGNRVWLNNINNIEGQEGIFNDSGQSLGSSNTQSVVLGDIDGDGDLDLITGNYNAPNRVWLNNIGNTAGQEGIFTDSGQTFVSATTFSVTLGDVDGDTDLDLIAGNNNQPDQVWLNSGVNSGVFVADQSIGTSATRSVSLGDVDGDGDLDLVAGNYSANNIVWINDGSASNMFNSSRTLTNTDATLQVLLRDIDGDSDLDIIEGIYGNVNRVFINNGKGLFNRVLDNGDSANPNDNTDSSSIATGDVDGDGDIDLLTGNRGGQPNLVWLNDF